MVKTMCVLRSILCVFLSLSQNGEMSELVSLNRPTTQFLNYFFPITSVVDGNLNSCEDQDGEEPRESWTINLQKQVTIEKVEVYYSETSIISGFLGDLFSDGHELYLSNTTTRRSSDRCFEDHSENQIQLTVSHFECTKTAQYVIIYNDLGISKSFELCEVKVYGCDEGTYGNGHCDQKCSSECPGTLCHPNSGSCLYAPNTETKIAFLLAIIIPAAVVVPLAILSTVLIIIFIKRRKRRVPTGNEEQQGGTVNAYNELNTMELQPPTTYEGLKNASNNPGRQERDNMYNDLDARDIQPRNMYEGLGNTSNSQGRKHQDAISYTDLNTKELQPPNMYEGLGKASNSQGRNYQDDVSYTDLNTKELQPPNMYEPLGNASNSQGRKNQDDSYTDINTKGLQPPNIYEDLKNARNSSDYDSCTDLNKKG